MTNSRRSFIKKSIIAGTGIIISPVFSCKGSSRNFLRDIGICTGISNWKILETGGYAYVEEAVQNFLVPLEEESVFNEKLALLKQSGLPVPALNSFIPGKLKSVGPEPMHDEILKYADTAFRRAQIVGVKHIVFGSSGSRKVPEGCAREAALEQFTALCGKLAPIAAKYDVTIVLEPLNKGECNLLNSVADGGKIVRNVNHKNFMLLADIYHMLRENESPASITANADLIKHVHIAENKERAAPGTYNDDFRPYFRALKEIDYKGQLSIECNWKNMEEQAAPALQVLRSQISSI